MDYLTKDVVEMINRKLVSDAEFSYNYEGGIDFVLSNVKDLFENLSEEDEIIAKASYLWYNIAVHQYFTNGNKRTGYVVADVFLSLNGLKLGTTEDEKFFISKMLANGAYSLERVQQWITKSLK